MTYKDTILIILIFCWLMFLGCPGDISKKNILTFHPDIPRTSPNVQIDIIVRSPWDINISQEFLLKLSIARRFQPKTGQACNFEVSEYVKNLSIN